MTAKIVRMRDRATSVIIQRKTSLMVLRRRSLRLALGLLTLILMVSYYALVILLARELGVIESLLVFSYTRIRLITMDVFIGNEMLTHRYRDR
jgi:hypothetical protein